VCPFFSGGSWVPIENKLAWAEAYTSIPSGILVHPTIWPQRTLAENWGLCPFTGGGAGTPSNTMSSRPRPNGCIWIKMPLGMEVGLGPGDVVLDVDWGPRSPLPKKGAETPQIFGPCFLRPNGFMDQDGTWHGGRPQPRRLCVRWKPSRPFPKRGQSPLPIFGP